MSVNMRARLHYHVQRNTTCHMTQCHESSRQQVLTTLRCDYGVQLGEAVGPIALGKLWGRMALGVVMHVTPKVVPLRMTPPKFPEWS